MTLDVYRGRKTTMQQYRYFIIIIIIIVFVAAATTTVSKFYSITVSIKTKNNALKQWQTPKSVNYDM